MHLRYGIVLAGILALTACAKPTTYAPPVTAAEIKAEQIRQQEAAQSNPFPKIKEPVEVTDAMRERLDSIADKVAPQATHICEEIQTNTPRQPICSFEVELSEDVPGVNAYADGSKVVISSTMMAFAEKDTHLAFVLAHELAHNIMRHPQRNGQNVLAGVLLGSAVDVFAGTGKLGQAGAQVGQLAYSSDFENEADYIGLYILKRAGYPIAEAPEFWAAMSRYNPEGITLSSTHPTFPERYVVMRKTINEINSKEQIGMPMLPEFLPSEQKTAAK